MTKRRTKTIDPAFSVWLGQKKGEFRLSNKKIADAVEVDQSAVARWLRADRLPERAQVVALATLFKVSPLRILWLTDRQALMDEIGIVERQQSMAELLAHVPELADDIELLLRLPPKRRAALILLAKSAEPGGDRE